MADTLKMLDEKSESTDFFLTAFLFSIQRPSSTEKK